MLSKRTAAYVRHHIRQTIARGHADPVSTMGQLYSDPEVYRETMHLSHDDWRRFCERRWNAEMEMKLRAMGISEPKSA